MLALVRVASEVNIKSGKVKARFLRALMANMRAAMTDAGIKVSFKEKWSRIFVEADSPAAIGVLMRVFGVGSVSPIEKTCPSEVEAIEREAMSYGPRLAGKTFRVAVKRAGVEGFTSQDLEVRLGALLQQFSAGVDLSKPDVTIGLEVRPEGTFFYSEKLPGPGGLPLGVEGRALCLISGGFDSAVAAWQLMKRGVALDFLFCNLSGLAYERSVVCVTKALCQQWAQGSKPRLIVTDFNPIVASLKERVKPSFSQVVLKRTMMKVANLIAERLGDCPALVTGEAMGQVSSQTLHNLAAIEEASERPILRPLIGLDKEEIIAYSRRIGTYVFSAGVREYCALVPKNTVVRGSIPVVRREEELIPQELYQGAVNDCKVIDVLSLKDEDLITDYLFTDHVPKDAKVLDCRPSHQFDAWHYPEAEQWDVEDILIHYSKWDKTIPYVLYCPTGLQTAVAAEKMQNSGFTAYSFRGGTRALARYLTARERQECENSP